MPIQQFPLYYHELYSSGLIGCSARFPVDRYKLLAEQLQAKDEDKLIAWHTPRLASRDEVLARAQKRLCREILHHQLLEKEIRRIGLRPWKDTIVERHFA